MLTSNYTTNNTSEGFAAPPLRRIARQLQTRDGQGSVLGWGLPVPAPTNTANRRLIHANVHCR